MPRSKVRDMHDCDIQDCVICEWMTDRIMRFNEELKQILIATAPPPIRVRRWLPGDSDS